MVARADTFFQDSRSILQQASPIIGLLEKFTNGRITVAGSRGRAMERNLRRQVGMATDAMIESVAATFKAGDGKDDDLDKVSRALLRAAMAPTGRQVSLPIARETDAQAFQPVAMKASKPAPVVFEPAPDTGDVTRTAMANRERLLHDLAMTAGDSMRADTRMLAFQTRRVITAMIERISPVFERNKAALEGLWMRMPTSLKGVLSPETTAALALAGTLVAASWAASLPDADTGVVANSVIEQSDITPSPGPFIPMLTLMPKPADAAAAQPAPRIIPLATGKPGRPTFMVQASETPDGSPRIVKASVTTGKEPVASQAFGQRVIPLSQDGTLVADAPYPVGIRSALSAAMSTDAVDPNKPIDLAAGDAEIDEETGFDPHEPQTGAWAFPVATTPITIGFGGTDTGIADPSAEFAEFAAKSIAVTVKNKELAPKQVNRIFDAAATCSMAATPCKASSLGVEIDLVNGIHTVLVLPSAGLGPTPVAAAMDVNGTFTVLDQTAFDYVNERYDAGLESFYENAPLRR